MLSYLPSSIHVMPSDHTSTFPSYWPSSMARITSGAILHQSIIFPTINSASAISFQNSTKLHMQDISLQKLQAKHWSQIHYRIAYKMSLNKSSCLTSRVCLQKNWQAPRWKLSQNLPISPALAPSARYFQLSRLYKETYTKIVPVKDMKLSHHINNAYPLWQGKGVYLGFEVYCQLILFQFRSNNSCQCQFQPCSIIPTLLHSIHFIS